jgi:hypothetical protein|tara:strand:- start:142 stop:402 length:261 start_codon:yes stop_codon:yes gene_type:complete
MLSGLGLTEGSTVEALLIEGAMDALDFAVVLGGGDRDELVADPVGSQRFLEGVGLLHMGHKDVSELCTMIGLDLLEWEREGSLKPP